MNKKTLIFISVLMLLILGAFQASAFTYFVKPIENTITRDDIAKFNLTIRNTADFDDYFTISTRDVNWLISLDPAPSRVPAGADSSYIVEIRPKPLIPEGLTYFIPIKIKSEKTGFHFEEAKKFAIYVAQPNLLDRDYVPIVTPIIYMDKVVDPREKVSVRLNLRNRNARDLEALKVVINGEVFQEEYETHLLPLEDKTNEILFEVDPLIQAGIRRAFVTLFFDDKKIGESYVDYEVMGYIDLQEESKKSGFLFRAEETYVIVNNGNEIGRGEKKLRINFFERMFTRFMPEAVKEKGDDGTSYYVIRKDLGPEERLEISIVTNYRLLVLIILVIIIAIILYYALRTPIIIVKSADPLGKTKEGVSEVKVRVYLKNRSRKPLTNVRIMDYVPSIAEIEKKARLGSMEPVNIGKGKRGTVARWELDILEPYEERIITYKVNSKLKLIGGIRLPSAKVRFDAGKGKERTTHSRGINLIQRE